ncbi:class I SAM-dependent methyltransferase [Halohasta salina]|uniref:class I SAM-dependent methyltransferase n=1 Tax=Halohasta salina TaxID=2961621 RepID=UPI0020A2FC49|nr:class I SAM-dependent methyltransferase family protein [Halohasta salina]
MEVPCIAVPREAGEESRQALAEAGVLDDDYQIVNDEGTLYIPVTDPDGVPDGFETTTRDLPTRRTARTPADILGYEPSLERLGDVIIVDEDDAERAAEIADAVMASDLPVRSVLNRASKIKGELRVRDWELLAEREDTDTNRSPTETVHREYGHEFLLDLAAVYFSPRLATERHRVVEGIDPGEHVLDMFAGVGPFAIPAASRGADVVAVDLNETAVDYLRENARRNGVSESITAIAGDVRTVASDYHGWADRLVMNLPHSAGEFLETAVELAGEECVLHYYDIQHDSDPFGPGIEAIRAAAEPEYEIEVETEHVVRSYAPHEENVCLDVRLTKSEANR